MEIQSDLIILPANNFLPLPWSVRGPLGLATDAVATVAIVDGGGGRLPDIIVTPLEYKHLREAYSVDVELGERAGAIADFLSWLRSSVGGPDGDLVNIALSETITLEGGKRHKMHLVLHPATGKAISEDELRDALEDLKRCYSGDIENYRVDRTYPAAANRPPMQRVPVREAWLPYPEWRKTILEAMRRASGKYDIGRVVVSSNPQQRLIRYVFPRAGVVQVGVPHCNVPGALQEIGGAIRAAGYNILSSRLSRTPPPCRGQEISVFVAACEPMGGSAHRDGLSASLARVDPEFMIDRISLSEGQDADKSRFLLPPHSEIVKMDRQIEVRRESVREGVASVYLAKYGRQPNGFVFLSRRSVPARSKAFREHERSLLSIRSAIEAAGSAVVEAPKNHADDALVYDAVFPRMWASDVCIVLALDENFRGTLSTSIGHEIGFFAGRGKPFRVFVSERRELDPRLGFGNFDGHACMTYPDGEVGFAGRDPGSLYWHAKAWVANVVPPAARAPAGVERRRALGGSSGVTEGEA